MAIIEEGEEGGGDEKRGTRDSHPEKPRGSESQREERKKLISVCMKGTEPPRCV